MKSTSLSANMLRTLALLGVFAIGSFDAQAQYPKVPKAVSREAAKAQALAKASSDAAFEKALPSINAWALKGKPYRPEAAKPEDLPQATIPAFPGAWGGGMYSFGGRGGKTFVVSNLNDRGPGSFREACEAGGPRVVLFNVAGIIHLKEVLSIRAPYITISGATAPGDGVCIAGETVEIDTHDVVLRHLRFRRGETWVGSRNDALGGNPIGNIMIDHVSASWGLDENISMYRHMFDHDNDPETSPLKLPTVNITIQHSISSECLNPYNHSFGSTIGGLNSTFHHNLWACNAGRNPSVGMYGDFTFVNNVLFNWRHRTVDGGDHRSIFNIINNYLKPGPMTSLEKPVSYRFVKPESERSKTVVDHFGKAYVAGNIAAGNEAVTQDNWNGGVQPDSQAPVETVLPNIRLAEPHPHAPLQIESADGAFETVLTSSGATRPRRDAVDERIVRVVRSGKPETTVTDGITESLAHTGYNDELIQRITSAVAKGIITHPDQVGGYPNYQGTPYADADGDGLPDGWEVRHKLDPNDPKDATLDNDADGYSTIEEFIHGTNPSDYVDYTDLKNNVDPFQTEE